MSVQEINGRAASVKQDLAGNFNSAVTSNKNDIKEEFMTRYREVAKDVIAGSKPFSALHSVVDQFNGVPKEWLSEAQKQARAMRDGKA